MHKKKRLLFIAGSLGITLLALLILLYLYPRTHHLSGIKIKYSDQEMIQRVNGILQEYGIATDGMYASSNYRLDMNLYSYLHREFGTQRGNAFMRNGVPSFYNQIRWYSEPPSRLQLLPSTERTATKDPDSGTELRVLYNTHINTDINGKILFVRFPLEDAFDLPSVSLSDAREIVFTFIERHTPFSVDDDSVQTERSTDRNNRTDHSFSISGFDDRIGKSVTLNLTVSGTIISSFTSTYDLPRITDAAQIEFISQAIFMAIILITSIVIIIVGIKRIRTGEIGYRMGIIAGLITGLGFLAGLTLILADEFVLVMFISFGFIAFLIGGVTFAGWSVGESLGRETWRKHFRSLDYLSYGNIFHSSVGKSVLVGIAAGMAILAIHHIFFLIISEVQETWFVLPRLFFNIFNSFSPSLTNIAFAAYNTLFIVAIVFLFIPAFILRRSQSLVLPFLIAATVFGGIVGIYLQPMPVGITIGTLIGLMFLILLNRTDMLTLLAAFFTYMIMDWGIIYFFTEHPELLRDGLFLAIPLGTAITFSIAGIVTRDKFVEPETLEPKYVRFISERERLQREIEIAREVQMSFLPKTTPSVTHLDIAARCVPANEIGGDYYDFVQLDEKRTGIIIGDVSGKGTKAAFYMTLAKGMIHTTVNGADSPASVLGKVNTQFYRQTDRGAFISMVYSIFDTGKNILTVGRAGHNPVLYFRKRTQKAEFIHPNGMALGLDDSDVFKNYIQDKSLPMETGDIIVFYTDGITEAMNKNKEEFGNRRLFETITANQYQSAETILDNIFQKVSDYTRRTYQLDDMTMVVVKVGDE